MNLSGVNTKHIWTPEQEEFIRKNFHVLTNAELSRSMNIKSTSLRTKCYSMGLKKMELCKWTQEQVNFLIAYFEIIGDTEIAECFEILWPKNKPWTKKHIEKKRRYLKLKRTTKQIKNIHSKNTNSERFSVNHWKRWKEGVANQYHIAVWRSANNYPLVMIKFGDKYEKISHVVWVLHFGPIPKGENIVHKDGDPFNCDIENLEMIDDGELASRNTRKRYPEELKQLIKHLNNLKSKIIEYEK